MARHRQTGRFSLVHREKNEHIENYEKSQMQNYKEIYKPKKENAATKKRRSYLKSPDNLYKYHADTSLGHYDYQSRFTKALDSPYFDRHGSNWVYDPLYCRKHNSQRKALIIGERPSLWKGGILQRPVLPGNLFMDNLKYQNIDWSSYQHITWNQILESHKKDVRADTKHYIQSLPQKEAWLASIDPRYDVHKQYRGRSFPQISPRFFKPQGRLNASLPNIKNKVKDGLGATYYLEGAGNETRKDYTKLIFPEITPRAKTPKQLKF